jgi:hypothetical protein
MPAPESNTRKIFARLKRGVSCAAGSFQPLPPDVRHWLIRAQFRLAPSPSNLGFFVRKAIKQIGHTGGPGEGRYGPGSHVPARDLGLFLRSGPISPEPAMQGLLQKYDVAPRGSP